MKKLIILLLCISLSVSSFSYAGGIRIRSESDKELLQIDPKYNRLRGIILLGFSAYFFYMGLQMSKGAKYKEGDVELVGNLLLITSFPLFFWGITLTF